jgi:hypothetical protein
MTARATWRDKAACHDADPELFFPIRGHDKTAQPPAAITVTLDGDLLPADQMRLAQSLAESLIEETTGMRPQVSQDRAERCPTATSGCAAT